jgi:hypothetical protein
LGVGRVISGDFGWGGARGGVFRAIVVEEVGVTGEGVVGLAVDEKSDLRNLRQSGVEGADDGLDGEGFDLDAGGVVGDEGAAKIDDG